MHVALVIDEERLAHEQSMLNRLSIGLMGEGVQLTRIVPDERAVETVDEGEQRIALATRLEAPMSVLPWMRTARMHRIVEALDKAKPDIVYGIGERAWNLAADLGHELERPIVLDVCSVAQARSVRRIRTRQGATISGYVVPCKAIADMLKPSIEDTMVSIVPIGVALPAQTREVFSDPSHGTAFVVIGGARDVHAYEALLIALGQVGRNTANLQVFLELQGPYEHDIWRRAERLNLLTFVSAIGDASLYRSLLTRCDALLVPEPLGEVRSILLESMALGMPIVASPDPVLEMLTDGDTAIFANRADAADWTRKLLDAIDRPEMLRQLGARARQAVVVGHRSSDQVTKLINALEQWIGNGTYRFVPKGT